MGGNESIWGQKIVGGDWRDEGMNPKLIQKLLLGRVFSLCPKFF